MTTGSLKTPMPYAQALQIAVNFVNAIRPFVERVEIAGSLRRRKAIVGDIELVVIPRMEEVPGLFPDMPITDSMLDPVLCNYPILKGGDRYRQYEIEHEGHGYPLDLYITTPDRWGVIYTLRTGSSDFSKWLVTSRQKGGALPSYMQVRDGRVWAGDQAYDTPEESDFFRLLKLAYVEPEERAEGRWYK